MTRATALVPLLSLALLAACATPREAPQTGGTTSNAPAGAAAASTAGARAVGAYGAVGTSDDIRGRSSSSGTSQLTGRANHAGSDAGTDDDADDDEPPR